MNQELFIKEKQQFWDNLSKMITRAKKEGLQHFSQQEIQLLGNLYKKASSDLSYARSKKYNRELINYLNQLVRKGYSFIYLKEKDRKGSFIKFFVLEYPALFRENSRYIMAAVIIFLITVAVGYLWDQVDPRFAGAVVPAEFLEIWGEERPEDMLGVAAMPLMSSGYLTRNFKVGMNAFVLGITFGLGTLYILGYNGLIFGAIISLVFRLGNQSAFFNFVLSHAFIELMAIFVCGGAGFMIARGLVAPGEMYRSEALNLYGERSVKLVLGTIPMFLLAGIIESSFSRINFPTYIKFIFGIFTVLLMIAYFSYEPEKNRHYKRKNQKNIKNWLTEKNEYK